MAHSSQKSTDTERLSITDNPCSFPACECMCRPEDCLFKPENRIVTNPHTGGKVTCHKCNGFIREGDKFIYPDKEKELTHTVWFHKDCWNEYEHYYGLDKPID